MLGELEIIYKVVNVVELLVEGEIYVVDDVVQMNLGVDVIVVFVN